MIKHVFFTTLVALGLVACGGSKNTPKPNESVFTEVSETARAEMIANGSAAVSVAIYHNGEVVYAEAFGHKDQDGNNPVNTQTLFQLGSTTKMFTSLATLQLVNEGVISLNDSLPIALPALDYPDAQSQAWQNINIHQLMTHEAGFGDNYEQLSDDSELSSYMLNQYAHANPLMIEPAQFHNYANPHFSYLGTILEYYRQQDYRTIMQQSVFTPLGMMRTTMDSDTVAADGNYALGTFENNNTRVGFETLQDINDYQAIVPAGTYTWSTPTETLKMAEFLLKGDTDILSETLNKQVTSPHVSTDFAGLPMSYGYGIFVDEGFIHNEQWYPVKLWQHGGNRLGYTSHFWILPEQNIAVSILSTGNEDQFANTMLAAIESVGVLPAPTAIPFEAVNTSDFNKHVGEYRAAMFTLQVTNNNGTLLINIPELNEQGVDYERELTALGGNTFIASTSVETFDLTFFATEPDGHSRFIRNRNFVGIRVDN